MASVTQVRSVAEIKAILRELPNPDFMEPPVPPTPEQLTQEKIDALANKIKSLAGSSRLPLAELRRGLDLLFQKYNFSPVEELIILAMQTGDDSFKARICMFLTEFLIPKLKSIEVSGQVDHVHTVVIRRFGPGGQVHDEPVKKVLGLPDPQAPRKPIDV